MPPLDLQRRVLNPKSVVQFLADCSQEFVLIRQIGLDQVRRQSGFGSTHSPNMEIMHFPDTGEVAEISLDRLRTYSSRYGVQRQIHRLAQQTPRPERNYDDYHQAHGRVDPNPTCNCNHTPAITTAALTAASAAM